MGKRKEPQVSRAEELENTAQLATVHAATAENIQNNAGTQNDKELIVVLAAYDVRTNEIMYTKEFSKDHAERILAIPNSGWRLA